MTSSQVQLWAQRKATVTLIDQEPTLVSLVRPGTWSRTASGGQKRSGALTVLPIVKRFLSGVEVNDRREYDFQGQKIVSDHVLLGVATDNIEPGDFFEADTRRFRVLYVHPNRLYETRAECQFLDTFVPEPVTMVTASAMTASEPESQPSPYGWILDRMASP